MLNKVMLIGNLGQDPEVRYLDSGAAITNISLATSRRWKDKNTGEKREETEWHRVTFWGKLAEIAGEYLKKGSRVYIEGRIRTRKWQADDGSDRWTTEIVGLEMNMLGGGDGQGNQGGNRPAASQIQGNQQTQGGPPPAGGFDDFDDDIPFNSLNSMIRNHLV